MIGWWLAIFGLGTAVAQQEPGRLRIQGSDTMLQLNLSFAEGYKKTNSMTVIDVRGEGSGTGFRALIAGESDIAASSRPIRDREIARLKKDRGEAPVEHVIAFDPIAVYIHPDNPLDSITVGQLKDIFFEGGMCDRWEELSKEANLGEIKRIGRSNTSGTYAAFRSMVAGRGVRFKEGTLAMPGSSAVVDAVAKMPAGIGYSGASYKTDKVKFLKLKADKESKPVAPTRENVRAGKYPLSRKLYFYTVGKPEGELKKFLSWIRSKDGDKIVEGEGFVPTARPKPQG